MYDTLSIGSGLIDIFISSEQFELKPEGERLMLCQYYGGKIEVDSFSVLTGGGAGNTAVGFSRAGFNAAVVTETGKDTLSQVLLSDFHKEYVSTNFVVQEKKEQTGGSVILVGTDGGRSVLVHRGAASLLDSTDIPVEAVARTKWVHLSSISGRLEALRTIGKARREIKSLSWNPGSGELQLLIEQQISPRELGCEIFIVNKQEWESLGDVQEKIQNEVETIIVTDGPRGGQIRPDGLDWQNFSTTPVSAVDETGAGDAFAVGYVSAKLNGRSSEQAINWAISNSSSVVSYFGAKPGLLRKHQYSNL